MTALYMTTVKIRSEQMEWVREHDDVNLSGTVRDALDLIRDGKLSYVNGELTLTPSDEDELAALLGVTSIDEFSGGTVTEATPLND